MRFKIYTVIFAIFAMAIAATVFIVNKNIHFIQEYLSKPIYNTRVKEFKTILEDKKIYLSSFAKFLSSSNIVIDSYLQNDRKKLINFVMPLYKNLQPSGLLEEVHFFKPPATSFVNFANLKAFNMDVSKARADIVWVSTSFSPSVHFYVCRLYPGLRATYPIKYKDKLLGSVSFGIHIKVFQKLFKKLNTENISIYLNDKELKESLLPEKYKYYEKLPSYKNWKVLGNVYNITLKPGLEIQNGYVFSKIEIKDFFDKTMAYLIIRDNIFAFINNIKYRALMLLSLEVLSFILIFITVFLLFRWMLNKINEINQILYYIKTRQCEKVPHKVKEKNELDKCKNNIIDMAERLRAYINLLNKEVDEYSSKAYQDVLTQTLNRNFLEEKAHELFIKFEISKKPVGIIMIDIDDFKKVNDTYGHDVGDLVLTKLAETIKNEIRKGDLFIRYGGEEFLIILPNSNIENTFIVAEKIRKHTENIKLDIGQKHIKITISIGIGEMRNTDESIFDAIKRADINLYKAKRNGKNRVEV